MCMKNTHLHFYSTSIDFYVQTVSSNFVLQLIYPCDTLGSVIFEKYVGEGKVR